MVVNKLAAFDDLYYSEIIKKLNNVKVYIENNLDAKVFYQPDPIMRNGFESEMISVNNLPRIIFDIKEKYPDKRKNILINLNYCEMYICSCFLILMISLSGKFR